MAKALGGKSTLLGYECVDQAHTVCADGHTRQPPCTPFKDAEGLREGNREYEAFLPFCIMTDKLGMCVRTESNPR
jgi:hypothetical protein